MRRPLFMLISCLLLYMVFSLQVPFHPVALYADEEEPLVARELKREVQGNSGFSIQVQVFLNEDTNLQDLYISPGGTSDYSTNAFVYAVAKGVAVITERSITYRLYTGTVFFDVNGELWAISAKSLQEVFQVGTVEEQNALLWKKLIHLR